MVLHACPRRDITADYRNVGISLPDEASAPLRAVLHDESGTPHALGELVTRPAVLVFADYTCRTLRGPMLDFVAAAIEQSGLGASLSFSTPPHCECSFPDA
jgi:hypothetical protein